MSRTYNSGKGVRDPHSGKCRCSWCMDALIEARKGKATIKRRRIEMELMGYYNIPIL